MDEVPYGEEVKYNMERGRSTIGREVDYHRERGGGICRGVEYHRERGLEYH